MPSTAIHTKYSISHTQTHYMILNTNYWIIPEPEELLRLLPRSKEKKTAMVNSLATDTDDILKITNILNKCTLYTKVKEGDSQTLKNEENFKSILKDSGKENKIELTSTSK